MLNGLMLMIGLAEAGDSCKMFTTVHDPLNGDISAFVMYFDIGGYTAIDLQYTEGAWRMHLLTIATGAMDTHGEAGDLARIAVGGQILEFPAKAESPPVMNSTSTTVFTQWQTEYDISPEQLQVMASAPIEVIAMFVGPDEYRMPLSSKKVKKLQKALVCATTMD